jgi:GTP-binding protein HflX
VGFVERLPTQLVAAFRATLEELSEATLIVHVVDASRSNFQPHVTAVEGVLAQLDGVDAVPILMVWNKVDLAADPEALRLRAAQETTPTVCVSALTGEGLPDFWDAVLRFIEEETLVSINLLLPLELGSDVLARIRACGGVVDVEDWASGASVSVAAQVPPSLAGLLRPYRIAFGDDLQSAGGNRYNSRELP